MNADLERLIALQKLDSAAHEAERRLAAGPEREKALEVTLEAARQVVAGAKDKLNANQAARREIEKEVAVHQGRLSKFRDQAMAVKTNAEYHAIQHEITFAQTEIKKHEDRVLEQMLEADDLNAAVKKAEAALAAEQKTVDADKKAMAAEFAELRAQLDALAKERAATIAGMDARVLGTFDLVAKRRAGVALAEARDGICTICHVRLRPQVYNNVRLNAEIIQCDSCQRILYFVPAPAATSDSTAPAAQ